MNTIKQDISRGDIFYADLSPVVGCEQGGVRPVLILQNDIGNRHSPTTIVCAITGKPKKPLPTHAAIAGAGRLSRESFALLEQIRTIDRIRLREWVGRLGQQEMEEINQALIISVGLSPALFYEGGIFMSNKTIMFEKYPDVVEVNQLREMLGGISRKLAYKLLSEKEIHSVRIGRTYKIPKACVIEYLLSEEMCHIKIG